MCIGISSISSSDDSSKSATYCTLGSSCCRMITESECIATNHLDLFLLFTFQLFFVFRLFLLFNNTIEGACREVVNIAILQLMSCSTRSSLSSFTVPCFKRSNSSFSMFVSSFAATSAFSSRRFSRRSIFRCIGTSFFSLQEGKIEG